jgi:RNA polymerase sigma factor (sigma-70 family)
MNASIDNQRLYEACRQDGSAAQSEAFTVLWSHLYRVAYAMLHSRGGGDTLAADCTQTALLKIHRNLDQCRDPAAFRGWAAQIARRAVIDAVRQDARVQFVPLHGDEDAPHDAYAVPPPADAADLRALLLAALRDGPLSERSRRVVIGRFFADQPDEALARVESQLGGETVLPSHIQVTRAKNLAKLRHDAALIERLREMVGE